MPAKIILSDMGDEDTMEVRVAAQLVIYGPGGIITPFPPVMTEQDVDEITPDELEAFRSQWMKWAAVGGLELEDQTTKLLPIDD